jgi:FkbM family methyltransferase
MSTIRPHWTIVDVGANFGWYTMHFGMYVSSRKGKVISIEANPRTHSLISATIENSGIKSIYLHNVAVSDHNGTVSFSNDPSRGLNNHIVPQSAENTVVIPSVTLDGLLQHETRIDLIKIDVEGAESLVWAGMQKLLKRFPECVIVMEVNTLRMKARTNIDPLRFYNELLTFSRQRKLRYLGEDGSVGPITMQKLMKEGEFLVVLSAL